MRGFEQDIERIYAYMAAFIDADGSLLITKQRRDENRSGVRFLPSISITNVKRDVLDFFVEYTGFGRVQRKAENKEIKQNVYGWKNISDCYVWQVKHSQAKQVIENLLPYFVLKRKQAENMLEYLRHYGGLSNNYIRQEDLDKQFEFYIKSKELNGKILSEEDKQRLKPILREIKYKEIPQTICKVKYCTNLVDSKGLCRKHYKQHLYHTKLGQVPNFEIKEYRKDPEDQPLELVS